MKINGFIVFCILFSSIANASSKVQVIYGGESKGSLYFEDATNLAQLLHDPLLPSEIYWRSAKITTLERYDAAILRKAKLLRDLKQLQVHWMREQEGGLIQSSQQLLRELDKLPISGHISVQLDPDLARISRENNPILSGGYILYVAPRVSSLNVLGLINGPASQPLIPGAGLEDYWSAYSLLPGADPAEVYLIQPAGDISQVPVAQWNLLHREPMAGATLFVGFSREILPAEYRNINQRIASLISDRMPK